MTIVTIRLSDANLIIAKGMAMLFGKFRPMLKDSDASPTVIHLPEYDSNMLNLFVFWFSKHEDSPIIDSREILSYEPKASDVWKDLNAKNKFMASQKLIKTEKLYDCWDRVNFNPGNIHAKRGEGVDIL